MRMSVVVPTRNRPHQLRETLDGLLRQDLSTDDYEIIVVDDGSSPPVSAQERVLVLRLGGVERSAARNAGARAARGDILVFVDDDVGVDGGFLTAHWAAQQQWPGVLAVGRIDLPGEGAAPAFLRFRRALEREAIPEHRGLLARPNFCTAQNMSIRRDVFEALGGFAPEVSSGEDQDLALRHTATGGVIAYLPEAVGLHRDDAIDLARYCRRVEWGSEHIHAFRRRNPDWPDNQIRERVNGPTRWGQEPVRQSLRKVVKAGLALPVATRMLLSLTRLLERVAPQSAALDKAFRMAVGVHLFRGYRMGLKRLAAPKS
jgi:glycosyltransferase involved in cell wall biosynthesis